jgi:hypothetical protein
VVPREGDQLPPENPKKDVFVAPVSTEKGVAGFSSTKVRDVMKTKDQDFLEFSLSAKASQFLLNPSTEDEKKFAKDFAKFKPKA